LQRIAFQLRIRADRIAEYDESHQHVWPELLRELERFGVTEYSIFRRGQRLVLYLRVPDFKQLMTELAASEVNQRWQKKMEPLFEPVDDLMPGESIAMMHEVFYMPGGSS
jgi:L-rhamnose mutarotase